MCFSYAINFSPTALKSKFGIDQVQLPQQGFFFNGFQHPKMPILVHPQYNNNFHVDLSQWGLLPSWVQDLSKAKELQKNSLNARSETAFEKPMFREAWEKQPCIVPASGFFEWQHVGNQKIPHYIYPSNGSVMYMAGIYNFWLNSNTQELESTFSILTTHANSLMEEIHNTKKRMPVILNEEEAFIWLQSDAVERQKMCKPCNNNEIKSHIVSQKLNSIQNNRNEAWAIEPAFFANQTRLF